MMKTNKKNNVFEELTKRRFEEKKPRSLIGYNPFLLTKELFSLITLYSSAVLLIFILFFSLNILLSISIKQMKEIKNLPVFSADISGDISFAVDKTTYELDEQINLSIINRTNKSIFLAPCQYFNKFEKKESNSWKAVLIDNCSESAVETPPQIEKISLKENQSIPAVSLGVGVWRGVSDIYMDCQKADINACNSKQIVYSNEFKIEKPESNNKMQEIF